MKTAIVTIAFVLGCLYSVVPAQTTHVTVISRIEVDEKAVTDDYRVIFDAGNYWVEARRTPKGFILPEAVRDQESINFVFKFRKYNLRFSNVHRSKFQSDWVVGVDEKPYSPEIVSPRKMKKTQAAYYIEFLAGHGTQLTITIENND